MRDLDVKPTPLRDLEIKRDYQLILQKFEPLIRCNGHLFAPGAQQKKYKRVFVGKSHFQAVNWFLAHKV